MTARSGEEGTLARLAAATAARPVPLGRYDVVGRLGQGGMGTVYDGLDRERGTRVALKTLSAVDGAAALRLKREFRSVADLAHPNLASAYELACVDGLWFFAMEHVDGTSFTRWARGPSPDERSTAPMPLTRPVIDIGAPTMELTEDVALARPSASSPASAPVRPLTEVRAALAELARGLAALHAAGLWHGDIKPENVLVRGDGSVVVVDFGLAEPVGVRGAGGSTGGTPLYMAPEQLGAGQAGPASDWYAVGTMLYEVLTGRLPFDADSLLDLYFQKSHQVPVPPRELVPAVPADLSALCLALLQAAPDRRPSGTELVRLFAGDDAAARLAAERPVRSVFVGRKRELRMLEQAYGLARRGPAMVVHAIGPSGIGKTAMLRSFTRGVEDVDGAIVLRGRCYERESVPYKAFDGIVDELAERLRAAGPAVVARLVPAHGGELAQVFPALAGLVPHATTPPGLEAVELRRRAWAALAALLDGLAAARPLVLSIDDLQWADADSAALLATLVADPDRRHQLVVVGYRPAEAEARPVLRGYLELAAGLASERRLVEIEVGPLPRAEAELLARTALGGLGGAVDDASLRFLAEEASGVPFFIEELARFAAAGHGARTGAISLDDAIRARVAALPAEQRRLLEVAAVADSPVAQSIAFTAAGLDAGALPSLLALRSASLLTWRGAGADDPLAVYHDRIRASVQAGLDDLARARHHLALGRALAAAHAGIAVGAWAFEAVRHLAGGAALLAEDERPGAARLALAAGRAARHAAAFPLAFACFQRGLDLAGRDAWTSDYELAQYAALAACARYPDAEAGERAHLDAVIAAGVEALGKVAAHSPVNVAHRLALVLAERARVTGDREGARRHLDAALAAARAGDWRLDLAVALELAARHHTSDGAAAARALAEARAAYHALGAAGKLRQLA